MEENIGKIISLPEESENSKSNYIVSKNNDGSITVVIDNNIDNIDVNMKDLICNRFGFDELVCKRVVDNGFDVESLLVATDSEINDMFPAPLLGTRAKFKYHLNVWRKDAPNLSNSCRDWILCNTLPENRNTPECPSFVTSPSSSHLSLAEESCTLNSNSLHDLLSKTQKGLSILETYKKEQILDENNKSMLISIIVESYSSRFCEMSMREIELATNAIQNLFPTEEKQYYLNKRKNGLNPTGKLHDKAVNSRIKLRRNKRKELNEEEPLSVTSYISVASPPISEDTVTCSNLLQTKENIEETVIWLQHNNAPWPDVQENWAKVVWQRQNDIKSGNVDVLSKWPLFKNAWGHTLIEFDYDTIKPNNKSRIFELWPNFVEKIIPYMLKKVKDKASLTLLKKLEKEQDIDTNSRDFMVLFLIHAVLKPPMLSIGKKNTKKIKWKPTIKDAQESCFLFCRNAASYPEQVDAIRKKYLEKGLTLQPIILVLGEEIHAVKDFLTYYDGILYKFTSFTKCFDICFKLFHVMNFEYPKEGRSFFFFIETYFYNFPQDQNPNIKNILLHLNK